ncbi:MAG TPA: hypothetical protein VG826_08735 [Pirellulales bacterium]|nr:hypothetical protein [Pirellulales bacterium]
MRTGYLARLSTLAVALLPVALLPTATFAQEGADDPLGDLTLEMEQVVIDLSGLTTGGPVQDQQKQIVTRLDKLIEELEKEQEQMRGGSSSANPMRPLNDSIIKGGPGGIGDLHAARKTGKQWAELPPHERDRIVQSMTEGFPAHYQKILERYYKQLAEETPASSAAEDEPSESGKAANGSPEASRRGKSESGKAAGVKKEGEPAPSKSSAGTKPTKKS